jgi:hypothetical protein
MAQQPLKPGTPIKTASPAKPVAKSTDSRPVYFVFDKGNYRMLIISIAVVALGFILMSGKTDIYNTTKTVIAPLTVLAGFALGFFAIFKKPASV